MLFNKIVKIICICSIGLVVNACSTMDNRDYVANKNNSLTVAKAQSSLQKGMSGDDVAVALGSPNVVTSNKDGGETWIYDKVSTDETVASSGISGGIPFLFGGGGNTAARSSTQKTLTIIVKFDSQKKVNDIAYHQSAF
jgi:outer membrane protein assembly factor BamE (lipoprotein component of BamABCDE complex)